MPIQAAIKPPQRLLIVEIHSPLIQTISFRRLTEKTTHHPPLWLAWLKDRMTILYTDHNMVSGHDGEISPLSGVLSEAEAFQRKTYRWIRYARHVGSAVRYPSVVAALGSGIRMSWTGKWC